MSKLTDAELWEALEDLTAEAEFERVLAMTPEERRRELADAGFDLAALDAESDAFFATLEARIAAAPTGVPAPDDAGTPERTP
jgi:hypothetical protein